MATPPNKTTVTGPFYDGRGNLLADGRIIFTRGSWDKAGNAVIVHGSESVDVVAGQFSIPLALTDGDRGELWNASYIYPDHHSGKETTMNLGVFALEGALPVELGELLGAGDHPPSTQIDALAAALAAKAASLAAAADAAASRLAASDSAIAAALYDGYRIDSVAGFSSDTAMSYTAGQPGTVMAGNAVFATAEGLSLAVLASGAVTYDAINVNGVKLSIQSRAAFLPDYPPVSSTLKASVADPYSTAKYDIIGGVIRQNPADRTKWEFLDDEAHTPVGFDPDPDLVASDGTTNLAPRAAGASLLLFFKHATDARKIDVEALGYYDRIIACNASADEELLRYWGIQVGARVTRSGLQIYGSMSKARHGRIYWSGSAWVVAEDAFHPTGDVTVSWDSVSGILTVNHDWLPGQALSLEPDTRLGIVGTPFIPARYEVNTNGTQFKVQFLADGTGPGFSPRTGAPGSGMCFRWTKTYNGPVVFDGLNGWDNIPWSTENAGNIWIQGFMRREAPEA